MVYRYLNLEKIRIMNFRVVTLRLLEAKSDEIGDRLQ